jgi:peptide/nickel transport system permease protein
VTRDTKIALAGVGILAVVAIVGPMVAPDPLRGDLAHGMLLPPSQAHWLGTDQFARDIFARLSVGARVSLSIGLIAVVVASMVGTLLGLAAGASRGWMHQALGRVIDLGLALPRVIVLLVVLAAVGAVPLVMLAIILGLTGWPAIARLVRGETMRLQHAAWVDAATALGAPSARLLRRHILPGTMPPVLVAATLGLADAILLEAGLSFLGIGVRPPDPSWGNMLYEARDQIASAPWLLFAPSAALVLATSTATLLGDALRRFLQPDLP